MSAAGFSRQLRAQGWLWFLALGVAMTIGYFLLPTPDHQEFAYQVPGMLAVVAIVFAIALHRPPDPRPWIALAVGLTLSTAGDWTWVLLDRVWGIEPFPSVADVFYLGGMGMVAVAIAWLVKGRLPEGDRAGLLDALIVAVGVGLVSWVFLMAPIVADDSQSMLEIGVALAYPMLDILLLGVLVRLLLAPGQQVPAERLVMGALLAFLLADFPYAMLALVDGYSTGHVVEAGWLIGAGLWGSAALHPSMRKIADPVAPGEPQLSAWRILLLAGASLMAPGVLVIQWMSGQPLDVPVVAAGCVVLFLLVIARLGGVVGALHTTLDQRRILEKELERRALHDPLTGLANRVLFRDRLSHALARREGSVAVMFLDLDDFKTVNDAYGHAAGDTVLNAVADALRAATRPEDTIARLGGDEFAILLADSPERYQAGLVAGRLLDAIQVPVKVSGHLHTIGASIGIALGSGSVTEGSGVMSPATSEELMRDADIAMYVAKGQGKGTFTVFEPTEHLAVVRGIELRNDLERAITERQFELLFEPIISLETGMVSGVEALVRWRHPVLGVLRPAEFIPMAESTGAIVPLGRWILEEACRLAATWSSSGSGPPRTAAPPAAPFVSVNLSAVQLADPGFAAHATEILERTGLAPRQLVLELTETARLDQDTAAAAIRALRALGVRLAIDDFGTGYASLSQLFKTPFDLVKIDRSFVSPLRTEPRAESLIAGILDLARRLQVEVVAEGIEDGIQLARLRQAGCDFGQGFHFAAPMPPTELAAFLRDHDSVPASPPATLRRSTSPDPLS